MDGHKDMDEAWRWNKYAYTKFSMDIFVPIPNLKSWELLILMHVPSQCEDFW